MLNHGHSTDLSQPVGAVIRPRFSSSSCPRLFLSLKVSGASTDLYHAVLSF